MCCVYLSTYTVHISHLRIGYKFIVHCLEGEVQFRDSDLVVLVPVHVVVDPPVVGQLLLVYDAVLGQVVQRVYTL